MKSENDLLIDFIRKISRKKNIELTKTTKLFKNKVLDSMNILDLIGYVENKIRRKLDDNEISMKNFQSAKSIIGAFFNGKRNN